MSADLDSDIESEWAILFFLLSVLVVGDVIDYRINEGYKYFEKSIYKIREELFNYKLYDLYLFIDTTLEKINKIG